MKSFALGNVAVFAEFVYGMGGEEFSLCTQVFILDEADAD